ncbi:mucin-2-like [Hyalella azteca]|uniref:Mucin-2-like n=1 Tax=Hyalella azteca TaxID=294128 RepID=A0A979FX78_HYAAZ|nr:mucin-2-like [Hyalella azteca]
MTGIIVTVILFLAVATISSDLQVGRAGLRRSGALMLLRKSLASDDISGFEAKAAREVQLDPRPGQPPQPLAPVRAPSHDHVCVHNQTYFGCATCSLSVICVDNMAFVDRCSVPEESCYPDPAFGGGVCKPGLQTNCSCTQGVTEKKPDPFDPGSYFQCDGSHYPKLDACEPSKEFLPTQKICAQVHPVPRCSGLGTFANRNDCRWYYTCLFPSTGGDSSPYRQVLSRCAPEGTLYSNTNMTCQPLDKFPANHECISLLTTTAPTTSTTTPTTTPATPPTTPTTAPTSASTATTATTTLAPITPTTAVPRYNCPIFVIFFIFWWPDAVTYMCSPI